MDPTDADTTTIDTHIPNDCAAETPSGERQDRHARKLWSDKQKADFWKTKRAEKKARKRERNGARKEEQQSNWEKLTDTEKQTLRENALAVHEERRKVKEEQHAKCVANISSNDTPIIVFDMAFWSTMNNTGKKSTIAQLKFSHSALKKALFTFKPVFTSFDESDPLLAGLKAYEGFAAYPPEYHTQPFEDVFASRKSDVVYLSADSNNVLETIPSGQILVIGSFVDHNSQKGATENAATEKNIRTARLPISETLRDIGNLCKVLTINHVTDCLVAYRATDSWERAFEALPTRRRTEPAPSTDTNKPEV